MIETVLLAFIVAKIKRYELKPIFKNWAIYPILICAATYVYFETTIWRGDYSFIKYFHIFKTIYLISFIILTIKCRQYKPLLCGLPLLWLGTLLNQVAIKANSNKMPVFPDLTYFTGYAKPELFTNAEKYGDFHVLGNTYTKLIPLTDIFDVGYSVWSIGDILIRGFAFIVIYTAIKASCNKINKKIND